jgi:hypothetical protein
MILFSVILTVVMLVGVATFIFVFERKRATQIEQDLRDSAMEEGELRRDRGLPNLPKQI